MALADVHLELVPEKDGVEVQLRLGTDEAGDLPERGAVDGAALAGVRAACASLRAGRPTVERALMRLARALRRLVAKGRAPLAHLRALAAVQAGSSLPSRRVVVECARPDDYGLLFEAMGAAPHWPGLLDRWQWLRYVPPAAGSEVRASGPIDLDPSSALQVTCVIGSHEGAPHMEEARHAALRVVHGLRELATRPAGENACRVEVRFLVATAEVAAMQETASAFRLEDVEAWLRRLAAPDGSRPSDAALVSSAGDVVSELEGRPREVFVWIGHSATNGSGLVLAGDPARPAKNAVLTFVQLAQALPATLRTRLAVVLACHARPEVPLRVVEHVDHAVVLDGAAHAESAAKFALGLLEGLRVFQPLGEAIRRARADAFVPIRRWQVQHWTRTLDARPFVDRRGRAVAEYLRKTPERPAGEERGGLDVQTGAASRMRPADWHVRHCVDLHVDEAWAVVGRGAATEREAVSNPGRFRERSAQWREPARGLPLRALLGRAAPRDPDTAGRWLILGEPGSGKSTMLQRERILMAQAGGQPFVPLFVKLTTWARARSATWLRGACRPARASTSRTTSRNASTWWEPGWPRACASARRSARCAT